VQELRQAWPDLTTEQQRRHLANTIQAVFIRRSTGEHNNGSGSGRQRYLVEVADRIHIVWATEPPVDVPRQGRRDWTPSPFVFPDTHPDNVRMLLG
jgi:hypothetical protein